MNDAVFVTAVYGRDYLPYLTAHLYSVCRNHPGTTQVVLWQDLPLHEIELLQIAFPSAVFTFMEGPVEGDENQRIPRKLHAWRKACEDYPNRPICFLDCDLLVLRPLSQFFPTEADVVFTWKDEMVPLNTGVILIRPGKAARVFLEEWTEKTEELVRDARRLKRLRTASGGGSQHSFREVAGWVNYDRIFSRDIRGCRVLFQGVSCHLLNETRCVPISEETHVVHYKAGWHAILLGKGGFTQKRPEDKCAGMYDLWLSTEREACRWVLTRLTTEAQRIVTVPGLGEDSAEQWLRRLGAAVASKSLSVIDTPDSSDSAKKRTREEETLNRIVLPHSWIERIARTMGPSINRGFLAEPVEVRDCCAGLASDDVVCLLKKSLGAAIPSVVAWLLTRGTLPRGILVEGGTSAAVVAELDARYVRSAPLPDSNGNRTGLLILPQAKDQRRIFDEFPGFTSAPAQRGWLKRALGRRLKRL